VDCPDFEWDENALSASGFEAAAIETPRIGKQVDESRLQEIQLAPRRGTLWVLKWAAAAAVIVLSAGVLFEFGSAIAAERTLRRAAEAGIVEALLPRATSQTVLATIERRLQNSSVDPRQVNFTLLDDGQLVTGRLQPRESDHLSVILSANVSSPLSAWFNKNGQAPLIVRTEREVPGRRLKPAIH